MQADAKSKKDAKVLRRVQRDKERAERQEAKQRQQEERTAKAAERKRLREEAKLAKEKDKEARKKERELQREREREARARNEKAAADAAARNTFSFQIPQVGGSGGGLKLKIKIGGLKPSVSKRSDSHDGKVEVLQSQALSAAAVKPEEPSVTSLSDDDFLPSPSEDAKSVLPGRSGKTDMDSRAVADKTEVDDAETTQEAEPTRENLLNLIEKVQKKDHAGIFKDPVTEQLAPGYFNIIKCPMDFTTIRKKLDEEQYLSWDALEADLHLMFDNCMTYNPGGSIYHQQANSMKTMTRDLSKLARRGLVNKRGATAQIMRKFREAEAAAANQARREAQERDRRNRMERTTRRGQIGERKENLVPVEERRSGSYGRGYGRGGSGMRGMSRSMRGVTLDSSIVNAFDETARNSYPPAVPQQMRSWCSLAGGANADGVCFKAGRPCIIQNSFGALPSDAYARSTARYACGLKGKARELVLQRAAACISTYPAPPPPPPSAAAAAAATPQAQMAAGAAAGPLGSGVRGPAAGLGARGTAGVAPPSAGGVAGALKRASGTPGAAGLVPSGICAGLKPPTLAGTGKGVSPGLGSQPQPWQPGGGNPLGAAGGSLSLPFLGQGGGSAFGNLNSTLQSLAALQQSNRPAAAPGAASAAAASPASGASAPAAAPSLGLLGGLNPALLSLVSGQKGLAAPTAPAPAPAAGAVNPAALLSLMQNPTALLQAANLLANINKSQPAAMPGLTPVPQTSSAAATPVVAAAAAAAALGAARPAAPATPGPANPLLASLGLAANLTAPQPPLASSLPSPHSGAAGNAAGNAPGSQP